jgi:hypothetical protein
VHYRGSEVAGLMPHVKMGGHEIALSEYARFTSKTLFGFWRAFSSIPAIRVSADPSKYGLWCRNPAPTN